MSIGEKRTRAEQALLYRHIRVRRARPLLGSSWRTRYVSAL